MSTKEHLITQINLSPSKQKGINDFQKWDIKQNLLVRDLYKNCKRQWDVFVYRELKTTSSYCLLQDIYNATSNNDMKGFNKSRTI